MHTAPTQWTLLVVLSGTNLVAMQQLSVRSTGPTRASTVHLATEIHQSDFEKVLRAEDVEQRDNTSSSGILKLPARLWTEYAHLVEYVKRSGLTPDHEDAISKLVELQLTCTTPVQKEAVSKMLYEDLLETSLERCTCNNAPLKKRIELVLDIMRRTYNRNKEEPIVYTSLDSRQLLHDFWIIRALQANGFKHITVNLIYSSFNPDYDHHTRTEKEYHDLMDGVEELSKRTGLAVNPFDLTKKIVTGQINIFSNAYDYFIRAHLENPELKSSIMTLVDPMILQEAGISEEPTMLAIYTDPEGDEGSFGDILIPFSRTERPRIYIQHAIELSMAGLNDRLAQLSQQQSNPSVFRELLEQEFSDIRFVPMSNPLCVYRSMIELALATHGAAYILADQLELITQQDLRVIAREQYSQESFTAEVKNAQERFLHDEGYIELL
jgi:hypothetical protein